MATKEVKKELSIEDLEKTVAEKRSDLLEARRSNKAGELVNPRAIREYRKEIARLMTQINERKSNG